MNVNSREALRMLATRPAGIGVYELHERFGLQPADVASFLHEFTACGVVTFSEGLIELTGYGKRWVMAKRVELYRGESSDKWRRVPDDMRRRPMSVETPYVPWVHRIPWIGKMKSDDG